MTGEKIVRQQEVPGATSRRRRRRLKLAPRFWVLLGLVTFIYVGAAYTAGFMKIYDMGKRIQAAEEALTRALEENDRLRAELEYIRSDEYIEAIAREQLGLVYPGETAVVVVKTDAEADPIATQRLSGRSAGPSY